MTSAAHADIPAGNTTATDPWATADTFQISRAAGLRSFRDWTMMCDNLGACTAISLSATRAARLNRSDPGDFALPLMTIRRASAGSPWRITVDYRAMNYAPSLGGLRLHVMRDGADQIGPGFDLTQITPGHYALDAESVDQFLADSRRSSRAAVTMFGHGIHGTISTSGLSAALSAITARQTAFRPAAARDPERERLETFNPVNVTADDARRLHRLGCNMGMAPAPDAFVAARSLDGALLTGQRCGDADSLYTIWLVQRGSFAAEPVAFPTPDEVPGMSMEGGLPRSAFNLDNGEMTGSRVLRARGDCGWQRRWHWTTLGFTLVETRIMPFCVGLSPESWPVTYRAP